MLNSETEEKVKQGDIKICGDSVEECNAFVLMLEYSEYIAPNNIAMKNKYWIERN
jgi:hypothetical protein